MSNATKLTRHVVAVCLAVVWCAACSDDPNKGSSPAVEYELFESTVLLDEASLAALAAVSDDQATLRFDPVPPQLERLAAGDILLAGASETMPAGLLRKVTSASSDGAGIVVETGPATVFHAFRRMSTDFSVPLGGVVTERALPGPEPPLGARIEPLTESIPIGKDPLHLVLFDGDGMASTTEDRVVADGKMMATVRVHFWLNFDWGQLSPEEAFTKLDGLLDTATGLLTGDASLGSFLDVSTGLEVDGDLDVLLELSGKSSLSFRKEERLAWFTLAPLPVGPLVFVPTISLDGAVEGGIGGALSMNFGLHAGFGLGFGYNGDDGVTPYLSGPTFDAIEPAATVTASADLSAELELRINFLLYGSMGPYAGMAAVGDMSLDRARTPCWNLTAGLEGRTGATLELFGFELASFAGPSFPVGDPLEVGDGACEPVPSPPPTDQSITPWSRVYEETANGSGANDGWVDLELAHDGALLVSSDDAETVMKVREDGTLVWARTFEQPGRFDGERLWPQHATPTRDAGVLVSTAQHVLVKLSQNGATEWGVQVETDNLETGWWASRLVGDDVWLAGSHRAATDGDEQAWLLGLGPDGSVAFSWLWGDAARDEAVRAILPLSDGALLVGQSKHIANHDRGFVLRVGSDGSVRWARHVQDCAALEDVVIASAHETMDGNLVLGGWYDATETDALLLRIASDGSPETPAWATRTAIGTAILGPQIRWIQQLPTGELRLVGRYSAVPDRVFVAGTDSIGRFAWLRRYGSPAGTDGAAAAATGWVTSKGGILVASAAEWLSPLRGGYWLFEVSAPDGVGDFTGVSAETISTASTAACIVTPAADPETTPLSVGMSAVEVAAPMVAPVITTQ